jgi:hypothetical protein
MEYQVIVVSAVRGLSTNFKNAAVELAEKVNSAIRNGWEPSGGVTVGETQSTNEPFLLQAMVKR